MRWPLNFGTNGHRTGMARQDCAKPALPRSQSALTDRHAAQVGETPLSTAQPADSCCRSDGILSRCLQPFRGPFLAGWPVLTPMAVLLLVTTVLHVTPADRWISSCFYCADSESWPLFHATGCFLFYRRGIYPPFLLALAGLGLTVLGLTIRRRRDWLRPGLFLLMVMVIGPGFVVNYAFKQHWGRPRPHQVAEFGGEHEFTPVGMPGDLDTHNSSFPSGHAAVAFYLMAPAFLAHQRSVMLGRILFTLGIAYGIGMGTTRVIQGGHFLSDVLWSGSIVYLTCVACARLLLRQSSTSDAVANATNLAPAAAISIQADPLPRAA